MYVFAAVLIGFTASVLSGMFGIGGAAVSTPALRIFLGASPAIALGTTLPVTIPTALAGAVTYSRRGLLDRRTALWCALGGAVGSAAGALLTKAIDLHYLMLATGAVVFYIAGLTVYRGASGRLTGSPPPPEKEGPGTIRQGGAPVSLMILVGLASGLFSGLLGLGGGVIMIPAFLYLLGMPIKKAIGTSLAVIAVIAVPGTVVHAWIGHVSWRLCLYLMIGVIPGAYLGARITIRTGERLVYLLFGALVFMLGVVFVVNEIISMTRT